MAVERLSRQEAVDLVRHCLEHGSVIQSGHFRKELFDEGVEFDDALLVLRSGQIYDEPEHDIRKGEWKYRMEGYEPGGKWLVIVFSFKAEDERFLITVFSVQSRRRP